MAHTAYVGEGHLHAHGLEAYEGGGQVRSWLTVNVLHKVTSIVKVKSVAVVTVTVTMDVCGCSYSHIDSYRPQLREWPQMQV